MSRWRRLTKVSGLAVGTVAAGAGALFAAEKIIVGRQRLRPDPAAGEPLGQVRGRPLTVLADDGVPLHAEISGPDDAPVTIIFSHGYCLSQDCWHFQRQALAASGARLVCWDQRGHGRSGRRPAGPEAADTAPPGPAAGGTAPAGPAAGDAAPAGSGAAGPPPVSIAQLGADLGAVLAATAPGDTPVLLAGHSMGGMTIMALAACQPELFGTKVIGTVLVSTAASGIDPVSWLPAPLRPVARQAGPSLLRGASRSRMAALVERARRAGGDVAFLSTRYLAFGDPDVSPAIVDFLERIIRATPVEVIAQFYLALVDHDQRAALGALGQAPAIVLIGDQDRLVAPRQAGELAAAIPGAELITVPGAGHVLILERPDIVTGAITGLLDRVLPLPGSQPRPA
ncbi:MAG TPA: alpha/beta hydrolase [Streptosporangiaceae bacterium]|nr:alpha/beta hydrolase [Streptosporangiaceae bacterium]